MSPDVPPFARYVLLLQALQALPAVPPAPVRTAPRAPRRAYTDEDRAAFFDLRAAGVSAGRAAKRLSIPMGTAKFWDQVWKGHR